MNEYKENGMTAAYLGATTIIFLPIIPNVTSGVERKGINFSLYFQIHACIARTKCITWKSLLPDSFIQDSKSETESRLLPL